MKKNSKILSSLIVAMGLSAGAPRAEASDFHSPRTAALGGAGHAGPLLNDALYLNPAFASFLPTMSFSANYLWFNGPDIDVGGQRYGFTGRNYNVSLLDGRNPIFQAGVSLTVREDVTLVHVGASKRVIDRLGFGLGGKVIIDPVTRGRGNDLIFSTLTIPFNWLQAGLTIDNLFESEEGKRHQMYREVILGTKFNAMGIVMVYFDPHTIPSLPSGQKFGHELGVEFTVMSDLYLRFGNFRNSLVPFEGMRGRGYGAGFGWLAPKVSFDYGLSRVLEPRMATTHHAGMTVYF